MKAAVLPDRGVVRVSGDEARTFLNGLLTADVEQVTAQSARFAALLTPQGKIVVDCIVAGGADGLYLDCPRAQVAGLIEKLKFYKLRAKATIEDLSGALVVLAGWDGAGRSPHGLTYADPRLPALGIRAILEPGLVDDAVAGLGARLVDASAYEAHRIALGVPRGGLDFAYGDAFPHEADMDQLNGVDFAKGCYVGQEVVSRMEHRGTARSRVVPFMTEGQVPGAGVAVTAGQKQIGTTGSAAGSRGLALLRLDRVAEAKTAGTPIVAGGVTILPHKPHWARFAFPGEKAAE
jgi:folate-binding protein YgfZ